MCFYLNPIFSCVTEWKLALKLQQSGVCNIVVSAFATVSRPVPLKSFVYLDFMDKTKREYVVVKLQIEIGMRTVLCFNQLVLTCRQFCEVPIATKRSRQVCNGNSSTKLVSFCFSPSSPSHGHHDKEEVPTPLKPDPLGLESNQPFKGRTSTRSNTKFKSVPYVEPEHDETEDDYDVEHCKRLEEEFDADYDYPNQEEVGHFGEAKQQPAEKEAADTTDSGDGLSSDSDSEEEKNYVKPCSKSVPQHEDSSCRGIKRTIEDVEEEEGEVNDDSDITQPQVSST